MKRVLIDYSPYLKEANTPNGVWPCFWIRHKNFKKPPFVCAFKKEFKSEKDTTIRVHVSADERYELYLDNKFIGRGSERGDRNNWFFG